MQDLWGLYPKIFGHYIKAELDITAKQCLLEHVEWILCGTSMTKTALSVKLGKEDVQMQACGKRLIHPHPYLQSGTIS